jgi:hypothetical protein
MPTVVDEELTNPVTAQCKTTMKNHAIHKSCRRQTKYKNKKKRGFKQDGCKQER